jgi:hypothetical protein
MIIVLVVAAADNFLQAHKCVRRFRRSFRHRPQA